MSSGLSSAPVFSPTPGPEFMDRSRWGATQRPTSLQATVRCRHAQATSRRGAGVLLTSLPCVHAVADLSLSPRSPLCSNVPVLPLQGPVGAQPPK